MRLALLALAFLITAVPATAQRGRSTPDRSTTARWVWVGDAGGLNVWAEAETMERSGFTVTARFLYEFDAVQPATPGYPAHDRSLELTRIDCQRSTYEVLRGTDYLGDVAVSVVDFRGRSRPEVWTPEGLYEEMSINLCIIDS